MTGNQEKTAKAPAQNHEYLLEKAHEAMKNAYAPYSRFKVGAALLTQDNVIFKGCNVENASYSLTLCAERTAISAAVAGGKKSFKAIAVVSGSATPPIPCGACLQVISEFCGPDFPVIIGCAKKSLKKEYTLKELLPNSFRLGKK